MTFSQSLIYLDLNSLIINSTNLESEPNRKKMDGSHLNFSEELPNWIELIDLENMETEATPLLKWQVQPDYSPSMNLFPEGEINSSGKYQVFIKKFSN